MTIRDCMSFSPMWKCSLGFAVVNCEERLVRRSSRAKAERRSNAHFDSFSNSSARHCDGAKRRSNTSAAQRKKWIASSLSSHPRHDGKHTLTATHFAPSARDAPEPLILSSSARCVEEPGCPCAPRPRVHLGSGRPHRLTTKYTGINRFPHHGFNGCSVLPRASPGDRLFCHRPPCGFEVWSSPV